MTTTLHSLQIALRRRLAAGLAARWRRLREDAGLGTVEYVVIAIAVIGLALLLTAFLPGYLQGWIDRLPT